MSLLRRLMAAGTPDELIDEVAGLLAEVRALEVARAKNAERQARWKANNKPAGNVTNVNDVTSVTEADNPPSPDKETSPTPPKEINPSAPEGGDALPRKAGGFRAPAGVTNDTWIAFCAQRKKPVTRIAYDRMLKTIGEAAEVGWPPGELFERAVERGYETIFTPTEKRNVQHRPANDRPAELQNTRFRAAVELDAERNRGQRHAGF